VGPRAAIGASFASQLAGVLILLLGASYASAVAAGLVFGFGMGGVVPLQGAVMGFAFGRLSYAKAMGLIRPVQLPIAALGNPLAGWIYDVTGSYTLAFQIFTAMYVVATVAVLAIRPRRE
jgi:cyanate permease